VVLAETVSFSLKGAALLIKTTALIQKNMAVIKKVISILFLASLVNRLDFFVVIITMRSIPIQMIIHELTCSVKYEWNENIRQIIGPL